MYQLNWIVLMIDQHTVWIICISRLSNTYYIHTNNNKKKWCTMFYILYIYIVCTLEAYHSRTQKLDRFRILIFRNLIKNLYYPRNYLMHQNQLLNYYYYYYLIMLMSMMTMMTAKHYTLWKNCYHFQMNPRHRFQSGCN